MHEFVHIFIECCYFFSIDVFFVWLCVYCAAFGISKNVMIMRNEYELLYDRDKRIEGFAIVGF